MKGRIFVSNTIQKALALRWIVFRIFRMIPLIISDNIIYLSYSLEASFCQMEPCKKYCYKFRAVHLLEALDIKLSRRNPEWKWCENSANDMDNFVGNQAIKHIERWIAIWLRFLRSSRPFQRLVRLPNGVPHDRPPGCLKFSEQTNPKSSSGLLPSSLLLLLLIIIIIISISNSIIKEEQQNCCYSSSPSLQVHLQPVSFGGCPSKNNIIIHDSSWHFQVSVKSSQFQRWISPTKHFSKLSLPACVALPASCDQRQLLLTRPSLLSLWPAKKKRTHDTSLHDSMRTFSGRFCEML